MKANVAFVMRRWMEFKLGHSTYLIFAMAFLQFTIITYALAVERLPVLKEMFPSMITWIGFFVAIYLPSAIVIGHLHLKRVVPNETRQLHDNNPFKDRAAPGKETKFSLPAAIMTYEMQLKRMEIDNQVADILQQEFGKSPAKWTAEEKQRLVRLKQLAEGLQRGESITAMTEPVKELSSS